MTLRVPRRTVERTPGPLRGNDELNPSVVGADVEGRIDGFRDGQDDIAIVAGETVAAVVGELPSKVTSPLMVATSMLVPSMRDSVIDPFVVSALISPLAPVMLMPSLTEVTSTLPRPPSTVTWPSIVLAVIEPELFVIAMSPRTFSNRDFAPCPVDADVVVISFDPHGDPRRRGDVVFHGSRVAGLGNGVVPSRSSRRRG